MAIRRINHPGAKAAPRVRKNFRDRYDELEAQRAKLVARLPALGTAAEQHAAYDRVLKLLTATFRRTPLAKRVGVLQAASWLIDVLEQLTIII